MSTEELELDRLVRKLSYHESIIRKILASSTCNTKIVIVKEKIEQFENLVHEIPDSQSELFDEYMDHVVKLWDSYSVAASEAGHRPPTTSTTAYPQPNNKTVAKSNPTVLPKTSMPDFHRTRARPNHCGKDRKKLHRGFARNCGDDHPHNRQH